MSYPSGPPGNSGYPSGPSAGQYNAPTQQYGQPQEAGPSKLPQYLDIAVAVLGLLAYLATFGPIFNISAPTIPGLGPIGGAVSATPIGITLAVAIALVAGLLAGVGLLPKQSVRRAWVAILSLLAFLVVVSQIVGIPSGVTFGWALYVLIALVLLQTAAAVAALLLDSGVINAPAPKPKYEQNPYGQYGAPGQYYGQIPGQPQHGGPSHQQAPPQRGGYPQQYGGYQGSPSTGGFGTQPTSQPSQQSAPQQSGPPTPPTGFPAFGSPQGSLGSQPTQTFETQQPQQQAAPQSAPPPS